MAAMVNMNNLLNGKDSRWLQLEVCREFQRNKCSRQDTECKFAHPPANVEVQNGKVTACYDSIKGRCNREKPPCKYFHPPQHLKDQLLINGRNHLALKNALMQQMGISPGQPVMPGQVPAVDVQNGTTSVQRLGFSMAVGAQPVMATSPYLTGIPASTYSPYFAPGHLVPTLLGPDPSTVASQLGPVVPQAVPVAQQKIPRSDRIEVCREFMRGACKRAESECRFAHPQESVTTHEDGSVTVCMDAVKGRCARDPCRYFHPPLHLQAQIKAAQSRATATVPVSAAAAAGPILTAAAAATLTHPIPTPGAAQHHAVTIGHTLEVGKKRAAENDMFQLMDMKTAFSGMVPYKRPAAEKSGIPVYQPGATTYQQLMQLQQPFVPVSCEYPNPTPTTTTTAIPQPPQSSTTTMANQIVANHNNNNYKLNNLINSSSSTSSNINNNNSIISNSNINNNNSNISNTNSNGIVVSNSNNNNHLLSNNNLSSSLTNLSNSASNSNSTAISSSNDISVTSASIQTSQTSPLATSNATNSSPNSLSNTNSVDGSSAINHNNNNTITSSQTNSTPTITTTTAVVSSITAPTVSTVEQLSVKNESIATYKPASVEITAAVTTQQQTHTLTHAQSYTTNHAYTNHQITHPQIHSQTHQQPLLQTPPMTPQSSLTSLQHHNTTPVHHNPVTSQTHLHGSLFSHTPTHHPISTAFTVPPTSTISYSTHFPIVTPHHPATYYPDPATIAKEVAQKNYANALKMAAASNALSGKPLTALSYTGVALNKGVLTHNQAATHAAMQAANHQTVVNPHQVALTTGHRLATQVTSAHSVNSTPHYASHYSVARPPATYVQAQPVLRPQLPHALTAASAAAAAATNPFAAAAANQQFMSHQQNLFYPGLMASYPFGMTQSGFAGHAAMHSAAAATGGLTAAMPPVAGVPQVAAAPAPGSAVVLNPYKKMKTS
ncbi:flocculation protein FLO11 isoform X3 [Hermetia illucens]|uniref:flocculation protein FLO11 isoform X3 n=1 Tax=Hermetia illucens TaxID=343691 RepID=UPI0018CC0EAC|nr:flocculation protein FLO11 isoform X3 [Hermetia illucens]